VVEGIGARYTTNCRWQITVAGSAQSAGDVWLAPARHAAALDIHVTVATHAAGAQIWSVGRGASPGPAAAAAATARPTQPPRMRVGYLSPDLHANHPVGVLLSALFGLHDRTRFAVYCISLLRVPHDPFQGRWSGRPVHPEGAPLTSDMNRTQPRPSSTDGASSTSAASAASGAGECEYWIDATALTDAQLYAKIALELRLHALVDLVGLCQRHRIQVLCGRPAPIQIGFLGFSSSMGAPAFMQYIVVDDHIAPVAEEQPAAPSSSARLNGDTSRHPLFAEALIRMPHSFMLSSHRHLPDFVAAVRPLAGLHAAAWASVRDTAQQQRATHFATVRATVWGDRAAVVPSVPASPPHRVLIGAFAGSFKLAAMLPVWLRVLARQPHAALVLRAPANSTTGVTVRANIIAAAAAAGVEPDRIVFAPRLANLRDHLTRLALLDVLVDTWPYNQHSCGVDALWAGLPVLTLPGGHFASRVGSSLLHASMCATLPFARLQLSAAYAHFLDGRHPGQVGASTVSVSLIAASTEHYEALLTELIVNAPIRLAFRTCLEERRWTSPLFDTARSVRQLETAYMQAWLTFQQQRPPVSFFVSAAVSSSNLNHSRNFGDVDSQLSAAIATPAASTDAEAELSPATAAAEDLHRVLAGGTVEDLLTDVRAPDGPARSAQTAPTPSPSPSPSPSLKSGVQPSPYFRSFRAVSWATFLAEKDPRLASPDKVDVDAAAAPSTVASATSPSASSPPTTSPPPSSSPPRVRATPLSASTWAGSTTTLSLLHALRDDEVGITPAALRLPRQSKELQGILRTCSARNYSKYGWGFF
jgi:hypothetical protein